MLTCLTTFLEKDVNGGCGPTGKSGVCDEQDVTVSANGCIATVDGTVSEVDEDAKEFQEAYIKISKYMYELALYLNFISCYHLIFHCCTCMMIQRVANGKAFIRDSAADCQIEIADVKEIFEKLLKEKWLVKKVRNYTINRYIGLGA